MMLTAIVTTTMICARRECCGRGRQRTRHKGSRRSERQAIALFIRRKDGHRSARVRGACSDDHEGLGMCTQHGTNDPTERTRGNAAPKMHPRPGETNGTAPLADNTILLLSSSCSSRSGAEKEDDGILSQSHHNAAPCPRFLCLAMYSR